MRAAIYARVSTDDQDCQIQLDGLNGYAQRSNWEACEYVDKLSGKAGVYRTSLEKLLADARLRQFDHVIVWKLDRFGRDTLDTLRNIKTLDSCGVTFACPPMGIDTSDRSPTGRFTLTIFAAVAELERGFIVERTSAGFRAYRRDHAAGKVGVTRHSKSKKDLPVGRPRKIFRRDQAVDLRNQGVSWRGIAKELGVPFATVRRIVLAA